MLWFSIWFVLVAGTVVGGFFLLRHVYRTGKALIAELARATDTMDELSARIEELTAVAEAAHPVAPVELVDPGPARARRAEALMATARRRARRDERRAATYRRWAAFSR